MSLFIPLPSLWITSVAKSRDILPLKEYHLVLRRHNIFQAYNSFFYYFLKSESFHFPSCIGLDISAPSILDKASVKAVARIFSLPQTITRALLYSTKWTNRWNIRQAEASVSLCSATAAPTTELPEKEPEAGGRHPKVEKSTHSPSCCPFPYTRREDEASPVFAAVASLEHRKLHLLPIG